MKYTVVFRTVRGSTWLHSGRDFVTEAGAETYRLTVAKWDGVVATRVVPMSLSGPVL